MSAAELLAEFEARYRNQYIDEDGTLGPNTPGGQAQCVNLANEWAKFLGIEPFGGDAYRFEWDPHPDCDWIKNTPSDAPETGDVVVWAQSSWLPHGHVDVAEDGATVEAFTGFDQNWPLNSPCHSQHHDYGGVAGWLRPRKLHAPPPPTPWTPTIHWVEFHGTIDVAVVNVRGGPGKDYPVLREAYRGNRLGFDGWCHRGPAIPDAATSRPDDRWFHIDRTSGYGWVASALVNGNPPG